jgi:ABC-type uncharacterized transport system ATPase subunit
VIFDSEVAAMRRTLLATKLVEVTVAEPTTPVVLSGVVVAEHSDTAMRLVVDTTTRAIRDVLDLLLTNTSVSDITVTDPPLEQVIAEIYAMPET